MATVQLSPAVPKFTLTVMIMKVFSVLERITEDRYYYYLVRTCNRLSKANLKTIPLCAIIPQHTYFA